MIATDGAKKISIGGIKFSMELVQLNCTERSGGGCRTVQLFRHLTANRVNMPFLCTGRTRHGRVCSCCIDVDDFGCVKVLLDGDPYMRQYLDILAPVGALTLYPHRSNLVLLGTVMQVVGKIKLPIYGIGTSLSTLTLTTDYRQLDRAAAALEKVFELPPNHAPFRPEFRVKQV